MVEQWFPKNIPPPPLKKSLGTHRFSLFRLKPEIPKSLLQFPMDKALPCQPFLSTAHKVSYQYSACTLLQVTMHHQSLMVTHPEIKCHVLLPSLDLDKVCSKRQGGTLTTVVTNLQLVKTTTPRLTQLL